MGAIAQWTNSEVSFPAKGSVRDKLGFAVRQAVLATTLRDWQPADFRMRDQSVELFGHSAPATEIFDADERDAMIHGGMALQHLKLTLKQHGCFGRVDLFPDLDQPNLAARVQLGYSGARDDFEQQLFAAMEGAVEGARRLQLPISDASLDGLSRATTGERSWLEFARCDGSRQRLVDLIQATRRLRADVQIQNETALRASDGRWKLSRLAGGRLQERFSRWRNPTMAIRVHATVTPERKQFEMSEPLLGGTFAVLKTKTDDKHGWLAAGQSLARLLLRSRGLGLPCAPFLDVLRPSESRAELRMAIGHKGFTQVILCFTPPRVEFPAATNVAYAPTQSRSSA